MRPPPTARGRRMSRRVQARRHRVRRWTAALLLGLAAFAGVSALAPSAPAAAGVPTLVAARDLAAGTVLTRADLVLSPRPADHRPRTALAAYETAVGRAIAAPVSANDVITTERLAGAALLAGQPRDHVAVTLAVTAVEGLGLGPGAVVDVYATGSGSRVATAAVVLAVREPAADAFDASGPTAVTVAMPPAGAAAVATARSALGSGEMFMLALRRS